MSVQSQGKVNQHGYGRRVDHPAYVFLGREALSSPCNCHSRRTRQKHSSPVLRSLREATSDFGAGLALSADTAASAFVRFA
jgi:hypothetical protein